MPTRRSLLRALGCAATISTAGCTRSLFDKPDAKSKISRIYAANLSDSSHRFEIRVQRDDAVVHESTHILAENGGSVSGTVGACSWMDTPGSYVVAARLGDGEWVSQSVNEGVSSSPEYAFASVLYDAWDSGQLRFIIEPKNERDTPPVEKCRLALPPQDE